MRCPRYMRHSNRYGHMAKRNVSICFTGPASSGKTAMISALFSDTAGVVVDTSCPTVGFRQYLVPFENPNVLAQVVASAACRARTVVW